MQVFQQAIWKLISFLSYSQTTFNSFAFKKIRETHHYKVHLQIFNIYKSNICLQLPITSHRMILKLKIKRLHKVSFDKAQWNNYCQRNIRAQYTHQHHQLDMLSVWRLNNMSIWLMYRVFQSKYLKHMEMLVEMNILSGCKLPVQAIPSDSTEINEFND